MSDILFAICAGHGGSNSTPGKRDPEGMYEWLYNNTVVLAFMDELNKYSGVQVKRFDDVTGKTDVPLNTRTANANKWGAHFYMSVHQNALHGTWGTHGGTETYYFEGSIASKTFAEVAQKAMMQVFGLRNRGLKPGNHLAVIRDTKIKDAKGQTVKTPAILIECGFMDSLTDIKVLRNTALMQKGGRAIAQAFAAWKNLKLKAPIVTPDTTPKLPSQLYRVRKSWTDAASQIGAFNDLDKAKNLTDRYLGYTVYNELGAAVYTSQKFYIVQPGDSLWGIAKKYGTTVALLKERNNLKTIVIYPRMKLIIP